MPDRRTVRDEASAHNTLCHPTLQAGPSEPPSEESSRECRDTDSEHRLSGSHQADGRCIPWRHA